MLASVADVTLRGRNVLAIADLTPQEIGTILALANHLRNGRTAEQLPLLRGKTLGMLFEKPSLRTRVSFEVAITQLGGNALFAQGNEFMLGTRETPEDAARVLSRYVDAIVIRTHAHAPLERFAAAATVPVINGLSALAHPCQALADLLTIKDRFGTLEGLRISYIGDGRNNVAASLAEAAILCGASVTFGSPPTHRPSEAFLGHLHELAKPPGAKHPGTLPAGTQPSGPKASGTLNSSATPSGATVRAFTSPLRAVREADVVYTDIWTSMGEEAFTERNAAALMPYRVNAELMAAAAPHAIFMHCLPAHRGEEVTAEVIDGPQSAVFDQAENRLHAQKALLVALLTDLRGMPI
jgi:ornithine carbamoyltransferase